MTIPTRRDIEIFLSASNLNNIFDRLFPSMWNRHFRAYPVQTQNGYSVEVHCYCFTRDQCYPLSHKTSQDMKKAWQAQILPSLQETCEIQMGARTLRIRFFHRKGYVHIPP